MADTYSASRIETWISCNRKAGFEYIAGLKGETSKFASLGGDVHRYIEDLLTGPNPIPDRTLEVGAIAAEALPYINELRQADEALIVEGYFTLQGRHAWRGYKDLSSPGHVTDWKTTSDFRWMKTSEDLLHDPQSVLYAKHDLSLAPDRPSCRNTWLYLRTRKPYQSRRSEQIMTRAHVDRAFAGLELFADDMQAAVDSAPKGATVDELGRYVLTLAPNYSHCSAYGGCPHIGRCNPPLFREKSQMSNPMSLLEKMVRLNEQEAKTSEKWVKAEGDSALYVPPTSELAPKVDVSEKSAALSPEGDSLPLTQGAIDAAIAKSAAAPVINPPPRGRGRPKKVVEASAELAASLANPLPPSPPAPKPPEAALMSDAAYQEVAPKTPKPMVLFVGCFPQLPGFEFAPFDHIVTRAKALLPCDYRLGKEHEFGRGNAALLDAVQKVLAEVKPSALVVYDPRTPEATLCLSMLRGMAGGTVEALR